MQKWIGICHGAPLKEAVHVGPKRTMFQQTSSYAVPAQVRSINGSVLDLSEDDYQKLMKSIRETGVYVAPDGKVSLVDAGTQGAKPLAEFIFVQDVPTDVASMSSERATPSPRLA